MQKQQEDSVSGLFRDIARLEADLRILRRRVAEIAAAQYGKQGSGRRRKKPLKSLRGIFPPSDTTMEDFRDARRSWTRKFERNS